MNVELIYRKEPQKYSPFDDAAVKIARGANLLIACPYLTLYYLERLVGLSKSWQLLTDLEAWFSSLTAEERIKTSGYIAEHLGEIRNLSKLHAKVLIGNKTAMVGSANFTTSGMLHQTEMSVVIREEACHEELLSWFKDNWKRGEIVTESDLDSLRGKLPEPLPVPKRILEKHGFRNASQELRPLEEDRKYWIYKNGKDCNSKSGYKARGYYVRRDVDSGKFCVVKGSRARGTTASKFAMHKPNAKRIRDTLIGLKILKRVGDGLEFTKDWTFGSSSEAACVVLAGSRSGHDSTWEPYSGPLPQ